MAAQNIAQWVVVVYIFITLFSAVIIGLLPARIAYNKGHDFLTWWLYGALLFIIALPHSLLLDRDETGYEHRMFRRGMVKCPYCAEYIRREAIICPHCHNKLR